jgi:hypothetical protein
MRPTANPPQAGAPYPAGRMTLKLNVAFSD